jgi:hypothetical protein
VFQNPYQKQWDFLTKAYGVFNVNESHWEYDDCNGKEVAIEVPPEIFNCGRTGKP